MTNFKAVEYASTTTEHLKGENWVTAVEGDVTVLISGQRDDKLLGEGIMRDLARRVQALRKEQGFMPTDVLESVHIAEIGDENTELLQPYINEMAGLSERGKSICTNTELT